MSLFIKKPGKQAWVDNKLKAIGDVECIIDYDDGTQQVYEFKNTVLTLGRYALAQVLANQIGSNFQLYVNRMVFGTNGTSGGVVKYVDASRTGLYGVTVLSKPVIASIDPSVPTTAVFTSVIAFNEAVGLTLNEMALQLANGNLYSMRTFPDLNKTSTMQITFNWRLNFV